jgi:hypothetical protein
VNTSREITENYQGEIEKWERNEYNDLELSISLIRTWSEYDVLVDRASSIKPPQKYQEALDLYIESLNFERTSYALFRDFIETGDPQLSETSIESLSNATKYELESFKLINAERQ